MKDYTPRPIKCLEPVGDAIRDFMGGIVAFAGCLGMIAIFVALLAVIAGLIETGGVLAGIGLFLLFIFAASL